MALRLDPAELEDFELLLDEEGVLLDFELLELDATLLDATLLEATDEALDDAVPDGAEHSLVPPATLVPAPKVASEQTKLPERTL
ncbi:hypothetical protein GCM10025770_01430 [Viridibacterium curvum]|uniref:Uncharacterized protein n=1 Tax=Viridibacterium curvum TaxID=1101404 RepID=A0ABP9QAU1_9RHOO